MTSDLETIFITKEERSLRLDKILSKRFENKSRTYFQYLIENNCILLNGQRVKKSLVPKEGDEVEIMFIVTPEMSVEPENIPLEIIYEDDHLLAINKKAGMVVHPAPGHYSSTFVNALLFHCKGLEREDKSLRPGIVHRLDKETSGVLLAAKSIEVHQKLIDMFQKRAISKQYVAVCIGLPSQGSLSAPIGRHPVKRKEMTVLKEGREAITHFEILSVKEKLSLILAKPLTGRTHQIRVHLKYLNSPVLGDEVYGNKKLNNMFGVKRQLLHAYQLELLHPMTQQQIRLTAPLPEDMEKALAQFNFSGINTPCLLK